jgi:hypothetical protein
MGLDKALDFILMNQDQFTRPADSCAEGLALIDPPTEVERTEAAAWMSGVRDAATKVTRAGVETVAAP